MATTGINISHLASHDGPGLRPGKGRASGGRFGALQIPHQAVSATSESGPMPPRNICLIIRSACALYLATMVYRINGKHPETTFPGSRRQSKPSAFRSE